MAHRRASVFVAILVSALVCISSAANVAAAYCPLKAQNRCPMRGRCGMSAAPAPILFAPQPKVPVVAPLGASSRMFRPSGLRADRSVPTLPFSLRQTEGVQLRI